MKERTSKEIRDELKTNHAATRDIHNQIEKAKARMLQAVAGGDEWLTLDDLCKELRKQLPGLAEKKYTLTRELFGAVRRELDEQGKFNERMHAELSPRVQAIIDEIEESLKKFQERLSNLATPYLQEGFSNPEFEISIEISTRPRDFAPFDNAVFLLENSARNKLSSLNSEWHSLRDQLAQAAR